VFLRTLWYPLMEDARRDVELALQVAGALEHGTRMNDVAEALGVPRDDVLSACRWLKRVRAATRGPSFGGAWDDR
jgi:hypothetical protein